MAIKHLQDDGSEIDVFTAEEVKAQVETAATEAAKKVQDELSPKITTLETELTGAKTALAQRASEFREFRKLSDEQYAQLAEKDRIIYDNQLKLEEERQTRATYEKTLKESAHDAELKRVAGTNTALYDKMKELWPTLSVAADTPEQIAAKAKMVLGMVSTSAPDLVATMQGFQGSGGYTPPQETRQEGSSFADTEAGKAAAAALGLQIEPPKKA